MVGPVLATPTFRQPSPKYYPLPGVLRTEEPSANLIFKLMLGYGIGTSVQVSQYS